MIWIDFVLRKWPSVHRGWILFALLIYLHNVSKIKSIASDGSLYEFKHNLDKEALDNQLERKNYLFIIEDAKNTEVLIC